MLDPIHGLLRSSDLLGGVRRSLNALVMFCLLNLDAVLYRMIPNSELQIFQSLSQCLAINHVDTRIMFKWPTVFLCEFNLPN